MKFRGKTKSNIFFQSEQLLTLSCGQRGQVSVHLLICGYHYYRSWYQPSRDCTVISCDHSILFVYHTKRVDFSADQPNVFQPVRVLMYVIVIIFTSGYTSSLVSVGGVRVTRRRRRRSFHESSFIHVDRIGFAVCVLFFINTPVVPKKKKIITFFFLPPLLLYAADTNDVHPRSGSSS